MPVYRVDWPFIRDNLIPPGTQLAQDYEIVALPVGGADILLSVIGDRLKWQATYRTGDYDYSDWDTLEALGAAIEQGLFNRMNLTTIAEYLDEIEPLLQGLLDKPCCAGATSTDKWVGTDPYPPPDDFTVGSGDPPQSFLDNPLADYDDSGVVDWDDYSIYLCDAGHRLAASMDSALTLLRAGSTFDLFSLARQIGGEIFRRLFPGQIDDALIIAWDEFYSWVDSLGAWLTGSPTAQDWQDIIDAWENGVRDQLICHVAEAVSPDSACVDVRNDMQSLFDGATWDAIWTLWPFCRTLRKVFDGAQAYEGPLACDCVTYSAGLNLVPVTITDMGAEYTGYGSSCTIEDLGDGYFRFTGQATANSFAGFHIAYRTGVTWATIPDLSAWTVTHGGIYVVRESGGTPSDAQFGRSGPNPQCDADGTCRLYWHNLGVFQGQDYSPYCDNDIPWGAALNFADPYYMSETAGPSHTFDVTFRLMRLVHLA